MIFKFSGHCQKFRFATLYGTNTMCAQERKLVTVQVSSNERVLLECATFRLGVAFCLNERNRILKCKIHIVRF